MEWRARLQYSATALRHLCDPFNNKLGSEVLTQCRKIGITKKKTARGFRGGRRKMVGRHSNSRKVLYRKADGIVIGLLNVQSAVRKALIINDLIVEKSLDILVLTETWLHECGDELAIKEMTPDGFVFFHSPRSSGQRGSGLAVIHRASIMVKNLQRSSLCVF